MEETQLEEEEEYEERGEELDANASFTAVSARGEGGPEMGTPNAKEEAEEDDDVLMTTELKEDAAAEEPEEPRSRDEVEEEAAELLDELVACLISEIEGELRVGKGANAEEEELRFGGRAGGRAEENGAGDEGEKEDNTAAEDEGGWEGVEGNEEEERAEDEIEEGIASSRMRLT